MNEAESKVIAKACRWLDSRQAKAAATGEQKARAQHQHKKDGDDLAEAVEKMRKGLAPARAVNPRPITQYPPHGGAN